MDKRLNQMRATRRNMTGLCKWLGWFFTLSFVVYCLAIILVAIVIVLPPIGFDYVGPKNALSFIPIICNLTAGGIALFVVARMLRVVGRGQSPFSMSCARQIKFLAIVLIIGVVAGALITPGTQIGSMGSSNFVVFDFAESEKYDAHIDIKSLFISIICFALSPIFRYGALLQSEADDLM